MALCCLRRFNAERFIHNLYALCESEIKCVTEYVLEIWIV